MPEGPSVYIIKEELGRFNGHEIINVRGNSKAGIHEIQNTVISSITSWGKHLLISLNNGITIRIHFMLFGSYSVNDRKPCAERLGLDFADGEINFYSCSVRLIREDINDLYDWTSDVLNSLWDQKKAKQKVLNLKDDLICDVLLNQDIFAGVGNIIKNEVLFRTKVQPESLIKNIPNQKINSVIKDAVTFSYQFLEWKREFVLKKNLAVHNKQTCPRCGNKITRKGQIGKTRRRAFYCGNCQKLY